MTATEKQICHLTARALRLMTAQDDAEADGDDETVQCLGMALGRLAAEAKRMARDISGHDVDEIDRVTAALIPDVTDEEMTITRAHNAWLAAHAEMVRAEAAFEEAATQWENTTVNDTGTLARYIGDLRIYGESLVQFAVAEGEVHLAAMPPQLAERLRERIELYEPLEG